jgi:RES domain-containing protein
LPCAAIEGPDGVSVERIEVADLPGNWTDDIIVTRQIGDEWLRSRRSLLLEVPSVLAPETWNVLVNPEHAEADQLKIVRVYRHAFDVRFFQ